ASPSGCASSEDSGAPLLPALRAPAPAPGLLLLQTRKRYANAGHPSQSRLELGGGKPCGPHSPPEAAAAAALEEGRAGEPLQAASGHGGVTAARAVAAGTGALALVGLVLIGAAAWSPVSFHHRASRPSTRESLDVVGLNVIGVISTTSTPPTKSLPPAPLRPPPDFAIEPPPGFYPERMSAAEEQTTEAVPAQAPVRPPPNFAIEPPPGFYPDRLGTAEMHSKHELPAQAPLRPPPAFIEPPPEAAKHTQEELPAQAPLRPPPASIEPPPEAAKHTQGELPAQAPLRPPPAFIEPPPEAVKHTQEVLPAQAPLRPPPDFAVEPPPGFYPSLPAEGQAARGAVRPAPSSPPRSAVVAAPSAAAAPLRPLAGIAPAEGVVLFDRAPAVQERQWIGSLAPTPVLRR
ncbi:unnamed protein product, partial [Prorocentrum cordatum]